MGLASATSLPSLPQVGDCPSALPRRVAWGWPVLPVKAPTSYVARWDVAHSQALLAFRNPAELGTATTEFWWVRFRPEVDR